MARRNPFPGVSRVRDRHGKPRWRFRRGLVDCYIHGEYGSPEFIAQYELALAGNRPDGKPTTPRATPGTFEWLIRSYRDTPGFRNLAQITRRNLGHEMEWLRHQIGDLPFARFEVRHVEALMGRKEGPTAANKVRKLLSRLFNHAIRIGVHTGANPARLAQKRKEKPGGYHVWTDAEIMRYRARFPSGTKARLAFELLLNTGAARQDLAKLGWQNIPTRGNMRLDRIAYTRGKTGITADLPIMPELAAELEHVPAGRLLFITHGRNDRPYTPESIGSWFKDRCAEAGIPHCNIHGVRKAAATRAANRGCTENEIAAILAHKDTREAATYTKEANRSRLADSAFAKIAGAKGEQNLSNLAEKLDKTTRKSMKGKGK
ncbi:MAG: integrase [Alphaproteobacteria bacterium]|nr:MAG: integrase [Alphaproteobacteria bacterium]